MKHKHKRAHPFLNALTYNMKHKHIRHIRRTHIIPHHLKGVKYYNKNIKKILMYLKLIVLLV